MYFSRLAFSNGAKMQLFIHHLCPHVWPIFDYPAPTFRESWDEIWSFIKDIAEGKPINVKAEQVYWDGKREKIDEEEYISMPRDKVAQKICVTDHSLKRGVSICSGAATSSLP